MEIQILVLLENFEIINKLRWDKVFDNKMSLKILDYFVLDRKGKHQ